MLSWYNPKLETSWKMIPVLIGTLTILQSLLLADICVALERDEVTFESALSAGSHHPDWFHNLLPDFLEEIKNPAKRGANFKEAGWCVALTCAAYESSVRGFQEVSAIFPGTPKLAPVLA